MSDKIKGFVVTLDTDVSEEYAEALQQSIMMMKNVISVEKSVTNHNDHMNRSRVISEMREKFFKFMRDEMKI